MTMVKILKIWRVWPVSNIEFKCIQNIQLIVILEIVAYGMKLFLYIRTHMWKHHCSF
jgi:hypothetical protein